MATISLSSCYAEVDPAAANSSAGCLAVLGKILFCPVYVPFGGCPMVVSHVRLCHYGLCIAGLN